MADGTFPGLVSRNRDVNAVDNTIFVELSDGSSSLSVTGGVLDVTIANATIAVTQSGTWNIATVTTLTGITNDVNIADGGNSITVDDGGLSITVDGTVAVSGVSGNVTVVATDLDIRDLDASQDNVAISDGTDTLEINSDGSINVNVVSSAVAGEVHDYDTATVAGGAVDNHDYTVANTTFLLKSVIFSASGDGKFEIQVGALLSLATVAVGFTTGKQGDTKQVVFDPAIEVPVTGSGTVRVIRKNLENQSQDVYSTIIGRDI